MTEPIGAGRQETRRPGDLAARTRAWFLSLGIAITLVAPPVLAQGDAEREMDRARAAANDSRETEMSGEAGSREAEMFGETDSSRDADVFGTGDESGRDDEIFAGDDSTESEGGFAADNDVAEDRRDDAFLGGDTDTSTLEDRLRQELDEQQDWLSLGGLFFARAEHNVEEDTAKGESPIRAPTLVDVYLDARPNDRVRGYLRGRLRYDFTVDDGSVDPFGQEQIRSEVLLDQMWLKFDILRLAYLTVGKQPVRWGSGRFWNPTDFLNRQKIDPLALFDERTGVGLVRVHVPIEALDWNLYAVANLDGASVPDEIGGALRAETLFGETEIAVTYAKRKNNPHQLGFDISSGLWLFDVRAELAALHGVRTPFFAETWDAYVGRATDEVIQAILTGQEPNTDPLTRSRRDDWLLQGTAAVELEVRYSDQDTVLFGVEYFYNDAGYKNEGHYPLLLLGGQFTPLYVGRHYLAAYVFLPQPGLWNDTSFTLSGLANLSDESYLARLDYQVRVLTYLDVNIYAAVHLGDNGELKYGLVQEPAEIPPGFEDQIDRLDPQLQQLLNTGLEIKQPVVDIGIALRVAL